MKRFLAVIGVVGVVAGLALAGVREHLLITTPQAPQVIQLSDPVDTDAPDRELKPEPPMRPVTASAIAAPASGISYGQTDAQKAGRTY